jgi:hypothetical protein
MQELVTPNHHCWWEARLLWWEARPDILKPAALGLALLHLVQSGPRP